jgi:hypothetical protein
MSNPDSVTPAPTPPAPQAPPAPPAPAPDVASAAPPATDALTPPSPPTPQPPASAPSPPLGLLTGASASPDPRDVRDWYPPYPLHPPDTPPVPFAPEPDGDLHAPLTPGFILGTLSAARAVELSLSPLFPQTAGDAPRQFTREDSRALARGMLAALTLDELRALARRASLPDDGALVDLLRRLSLLC